MSVRQLCKAISEVLHTTLLDNSIIVGDFNINWLVETEGRPLYNLLVRDGGYKQLISTCTTDHNTAIDHIYTSISHLDIQAGVLETYFTDHKQGSYPFSETNFQDFSRTFQGLGLIFQGL